jgi:hypothetical protein
MDNALSERSVGGILGIAEARRARHGAGSGHGMPHDARARAIVATPADARTVALDRPSAAEPHVASIKGIAAWLRTAGRAAMRRRFVPYV